jgi:phenylacetate-CoA ligase
MLALDLINAQRNLSKPREQIQAEQWQQVLHTIRYAAKEVPFYRQRFAAAGVTPGEIRTPQDLLRLPPTTKPDVRLAGREMLADGYRSKKLRSSFTTGATGQPTETFFDWPAWVLLKYALKLRSRRQCGMQLHHTVVVIDDRPAEEVRKKNARLGNRLIKKYSLSVSDPIEQHIGFYRAIRPDVIYGPPSYFNELKEQVKHQQIDWLRPQLIFTSAELLDPALKREIEETFHCRTYDIYGSTELKEVATECREKIGYHINADAVYVELVDGDRPVALGEEGDIVITSLKNRAMPLLRYNLGDRGVALDAVCPCGNPFPLMKLVLGRSVDYFTLADGRRIAPFTLTTAVQDCVAGVIAQYQIVQQSLAAVEINVVPRAGFTSVSRESLHRAMNGLLGPSVAVAINEVPSIPREPFGKYRIVKSRVTSV